MRSKNGDYDELIRWKNGCFMENISKSINYSIKINFRLQNLIDLLLYRLNSS